MKFTKMHSCGNDYIYVNCFFENVSEPSALSVQISDRHYGVGGDGLILIEPSERADAFMHMYNADGSEGKMCGDSVRCVVKYLYDYGIIPRERRSARVDTRVGIREVFFSVINGGITELTVDMGHPVLTSSVPEPILLLDIPLCFIGGDMGSLHTVYFLDNNPALGADSVSELDLETFGELFEANPRFPKRVDTEFVEMISPNEINLRVWKRGNYETLSCGTGAAAAVYAGICAGKLDAEVQVHLSGGDLRVRFDPDSSHCFLTGGAMEVFSGEYSTSCVGV